jgi:hypothetical protein
MRMVRVVGIEPTLLSEPDFEVNRGFHRARIPREEAFKQEPQA